MVANLDRAHIQNVASFVESREPWTKHYPDPPRSRLDFEMDWLTSDRLRNFHALLFERIPATACFDASFTRTTNCDGETRGRTHFSHNLTSICEVHSRSGSSHTPLFLRFSQEQISSSPQTRSKLGLLQRTNRYSLGSRRQNDDALK